MTTKLNILAYLFFLTFISILTLLVLQPFAMPIFVAAMFAILFHGLYKKLAAKLGGREYIASLLMCLFVFLIIILPVVIVVGIAMGEFQNLIVYVENQGGLQAFAQGILEYTRKLPYIDKLLPTIQDQDFFNKIFGNIGSLSKQSIVYIQNISNSVFDFVLGLAVMFFSLFYFFVDGDRFLRVLMYYIPLKDSDERLLMDKSSSMLKATLKGTFVIGGIQGVLGGILLAIAGSSFVLVFTILMILLSIIPAAGSAVILLPYSIYLFTAGKIGMGLLVLVGAGLISMIDNFLRPKLVGNDTKIHTLWLFFATLGGLSVFGALGFIIGPIIVTLFITLWEMIGDTFHAQFAKSNKGIKSIFEIFQISKDEK